MQRWLESGPMNILSFDVEHWYEGYRYRGIEGWSAYPPRDDKTVEKLLDSLGNTAQRATLFFTGRYAEEFPHVVKRAAAEGHEVASHSYAHEVLPNVADLVGFRMDLVRSLRLLEDLIGRKIQGYRAPKWSISEHSRDGVLGILAEEGLLYDSSFFPSPLGTPRGRCIPHQIHLPQGGLIWEVPATTYPLFQLRIPIAGGLYFRVLPEWLNRRALTKNRGGFHPGMIYLHPYDLDPTCPRLPGKWLFNRIRYIGVGSAWARLEAL